jgi:carbon-monoxide dehydrogenase medium subunit
MAAPTALVDVHRLDELRGVTVRADGSVAVGAAVTYGRLATDPVVREHQPVVATTGAALADRQVRNRGTIGGNCCLNDPTSNFPPVLVALDAAFVVVGPGGERRLSAGDFFTGTLATALRPDEVLASVEIPPVIGDSRVVQRHLQVGTDSWAVARAVVRLDVRDGTVDAVRVVLGAVLGAPLRLHGVEAALSGRPADAALAEVAGEAFACADVETVDDVHCSAGYRRRMCAVLLRRAVAAAAEGSGS